MNTAIADGYDLGWKPRGCFATGPIQACSTRTKRNDVRQRSTTSNDRWIRSAVAAGPPTTVLAERLVPGGQRTHGLSR